jgi:hypothetical protein
MALEPATLATQIEDLITGKNPDAPAETKLAIKDFATELANILDGYIKTATVSVTTTTTCGAGAGTGQGTGTLS